MAVSLCFIFLLVDQISRCRKHLKVKVNQLFSLFVSSLQPQILSVPLHVSSLTNHCLVFFTNTWWIVVHNLFSLHARYLLRYLKSYKISFTRPLRDQLSCCKYFIHDDAKFAVLTNVLSKCPPNELSFFIRQVLSCLRQTIFDLTWGCPWGMSVKNSLDPSLCLLTFIHSWHYPYLHDCGCPQSSRVLRPD